MIRPNHRRSRRGAMLPLIAFIMLGLIALLALAIDIGMIAVARSQCQNAADSAATAGARTLNGNVVANYNVAAVPGNSVGAVIANPILGKHFDGDPQKVTKLSDYQYKSGQALIEVGTYAYKYDDGNNKNEGFKLEFPRVDLTEPYTAVRVTVQNAARVYFSRLLGWTKYDTNAVAVGVHRPRDVIIIMDLSGSMRFQSLPGINLNGTTANPSVSNKPRTISMNPETRFPQFGHYSASALAALQGTKSYTTGSEMVDPANISTATNGGPPVIEDFHQNAAGVAPSGATGAFKRSSDAFDLTPGGDDSLRINNNSTGSAYAKTALEVFVGNAGKDLEFERNGYNAYAKAFNGYTEGPGYWGKTFFIWPPDPRASTLDPTNAANHANNGAKDWRQRFFFKVNQNTGALGWLDHTNILMDPAGAPATNANPEPANTVMRTPGTTVNVNENGVSVPYRFRINYAAILHWLRKSPQPFPPILRAGRIKYYDAIPDPSDTTLNNRWWTTYPLTNLNERFWKDYIDFVLGLQGTGAGAYSKRNTDPDGKAISNVPLSALIGNGDYYTWGTLKITQKPDRFGSALVNKVGGYAAGTTALAVDTVSGVATKTGTYVRFAGHRNMVYKVVDSSGTTITLDTATTSAIVDNESISFYTSPASVAFDDNPFRPRHQFWFGPMTFVDYLGNYNTQRFWWPGNVHEAQCWACKVGIHTAIDDIKNNHPGDFIGLAFFSDPKNTAADLGHHNQAIVPLGRNYQQLKDSLWFPPTTVTGGVKEITPYDADFYNVPRAHGGTAPGMGFMIAYNLLSSSTTNLRFYSQPQPTYRGNAGGLGRRGAQRLIIFETDGAPNTRAFTTLKNVGSDSYYPIRLKFPVNPADPGNAEWPSSGTFAESEVYNVVEQICQMETASPPGYSSTRRKVLVYPIGYGSLFDPANPSSAQTGALNFMQTVAFKGNTAKNTSGGSFPDSQRIYGTPQQRIDRIQKVFTDIMQSGVQISLIQ